jgi:hypothetical protein
VRRSRLISTLTAVTIAGVLCLIGPNAFAAPGHVTPRPSTPHASSSSHALAVLHRAQAVFGGGTTTTNPTPFSASGDATRRTGAVDATMTLVALSRVLPQLHGADRAAAKHLLARPIDGSTGDYGHWNATDAADGAAECGPHVCVNYTTNAAQPVASGNEPELSRDAESVDTATGVLDTSVGNGVPDQVDETVATFEHVWATEIGTLGYNAPPSDSNTGETFNPGHLDEFDVYLSNIGVKGLYGYCAPDANKRQSSGYCVLDNDYSPSEFGTTNTPINNLRVTAAHEFFHAIQFGYDTWEDTWFMESTAAWMEDEVYPKVNDNLQYLTYGPMHRPGQPIDFISSDYLTSYGPWVLFRYLSNHFAPGLVRTAWTNAIGPEYSLKALDAALHARHTDFATQFAGFEAANAAPASFYDADGHRYAKYAVKPATTIGLSAAHPTSGWLKSTKVKHTSAIRLGAAPKSASGHLRVEVRGPVGKSAPRAELVVHRKDGTATRRAIRLVHGAGSVRGIAFARGTVTRVDVILVNASTRFSCHVGTYYSCGGYPTDDNSVFKVRVTRTA